MKAIAAILVSALFFFIDATFAKDTDSLVAPLEQSKIGTNKFALKDFRFRKTETGKVRAIDAGLQYAHGSNMVVYFEKVNREDGNILVITGHITNDNIGFQMPDVQIVLGNARYTTTEIIARQTFKSDKKGHFEIKIEPKENEKMYFMNDGWPIEEYSVHELRVQNKDNKPMKSDQ